MATLRRTHRHGRPSRALHLAASRIGRAHGRIIEVHISTESAKDNWAASGDAVREAWVAAGEEMRGAMGHVAAECEEISA